MRRPLCLLLRLFLLGLLVAPLTALQAQTFSLSATEALLVTFSDSYAGTYTHIEATSDDPLFGSGEGALRVEAPAWMHAQVSADGRRITVSSIQDDRSAPSVGTLTVRTATHSATVAVTRLDTGAKTDCGLAADPVARRIYALYPGALLVTAFEDSGVIQGHALPANLVGDQNPQIIGLNADATELTLYFPATHVLARFDTATLALRSTLIVPDPTPGYAEKRLLVGQRDGLLYLLCHGPALDPTGPFANYHPSLIEVRSATNGALRQNLHLDAPVNEFRDLLHIEEASLHPERPELWLVTQHPDTPLSAPVRILRFALQPNGTVGDPIGEPRTIIQRKPDVTREPLTYRFHFQTAGDAVAIYSNFLDDRSLTDITVPNAPSYFGLISDFSADGAFAVTGAGLLSLETGAYYTFQALGLSVSLSYNGAAPDGLLTPAGDYFIWRGYYNLLPSAAFLPAKIAASALGQLREPSAGHTVLPPDRLTWARIPSATGYRVYLANTADALAAAEPAIEWLFAETTEPELPLAEPLPWARTYFWRVDTLLGDTALPGTVQSFTTARVRTREAALQAYTVAGSRQSLFEFEIETSDPDLGWRVESREPWLTIAANGAGTGTRQVGLHIDAGAFDAGTRQTTLALIGPDGTTEITLNVAVDHFNPKTFATGGGSPFTYVVNEPYTTLPQLLRIDAANGAITHSRVLSSAPGYGYFSLCQPSANSPLYVGDTNQKHLFTFSADDLSPAGEIELPNSLFSSQRITPGALQPASAGKLWMVSYGEIGLLDPATSQIMLHRLPAIPGGSDSTVLLSAVRPELRQVISRYNETDITVRSCTLVGDTFVADREAVFADGRYYSAPAATATSDLRRLAVGSMLIDETLQLLDRRDEQSRFLPGNDQVLFGTRLAYLAPDFVEARILPAGETTHAYHAPTARLLSRAYGALQSRPFDALPILRDVVLGATSSTYEALVLSVDWPDLPLLAPSTYESSSNVEVRFRKVGETGWAYRSSGAASTPATIHIYDTHSLQPETDYEVRVRFAHHYGTYALWSRWSNTVTMRTKAAPPRIRRTPFAGGYREMRQGESLAGLFVVQGSHVEWTATGLPPGVTFDPATQMLAGQPDEPGKYEITIRARNESGEAAWSLDLRVTAATLSQPTGRYSGIQIYDYDPLVGAWWLARSGQRFTGKIRTFVGTGSFVVDFNKGGDAMSYGDSISKHFTTRIDGVKVDGFLAWNRLLDECSVSLMIEEFSSQTLAGSGRATPLHTNRLPHPRAGRFTALVISDPDSPVNGPVPDGGGLLRLDLKADGTVNITHETSLGQKLTFSTYASDNGVIPFFHSTSAAHVWSALTLDSEFVPGSTRLLGGLAWAKYPNRKASSYRDGFEQELVVLGAPLPATGKKLPPLAPLANPAGTADFLLADGGLDRLSKPIAQTLVPSPTGFTAPKAGTPANLNRVAVKLDSATGLVTGSAAVLDALGKKTVRTVNFRGMLVKAPLGDGEDVIGGYFLFPDAKGLLQSGRFEITEPAPAETE